MADLVGKTIQHYRVIEQVGQGGIPTDTDRDPAGKEGT